MSLLTIEKRSNSEGSIGHEARIWGPPGTGKTTHLGRQITRAAEKYGPERVLVTSFTRAAAAELVGRNLPLPRGNVGTLHSHCYRALGCPPLADAHRSDWNREHPGLRLSPVDLTVDDLSQERPNTGPGDDLYAEQQIRRAMRVPRALWPERVRRFDAVWTAWKNSNGFMDFTDLLEVTLRDLWAAPNSPSVIFADEAQDFSRLQLDLLRKWGAHSNYLVTAADDDQTIYGFAGAAPEVLLEKLIPQHHRTVLKQSYRVPGVVHAVSKAWIETVALREPKEYLPREEPGELRLFHKGHYKYPEPVVDDAERYVAKNKTVMFLGTCSYLIEPLKAVLRKRGLPFHNPYRRKKEDWNPLQPKQQYDDRRPAARRGLTAVERVLAYLRPHHQADGSPWTAQDVNDWASWLNSNGILRPGALAVVQGSLPRGSVPPELLGELFEEQALRELLASMSAGTPCDALRWWFDHLKAAHRRPAEYPLRVVERGGVAALRQTPKIIIGTGHSVKGGEADVVYIFPDLSPAGSRNWEGLRSERDAVVRLGYVMMTRARESLIICEPAGSDYMPIAAMASKVAAQSRRKTSVVGVADLAVDAPAPRDLPVPAEVATT